MQSSVRSSLAFGLILLCVVSNGLTRADESTGWGEQRFVNEVAPILIRNCLECHHGSEPSGQLDLSSSTSLNAGGESGSALDANDSDGGLLLEKVESGEMPPDSELSAEEKTTIREWLSAGAPWGDRILSPFDLTTEKRAGFDWWSLQPIVDPAIPEVEHEVSNPIDAFVLRRLSESGLSMAPKASAKTLVRRLSSRLHGIHPTQKEVDALSNDDTPEAFQTLAKEYLNSHRYGERWARHWLDVARFGESQGFERDKSRPNSWRYRDWVINALNEDMPYDQFARMQIAGDCFPEFGADGVIATGFLVAGAWDEVGQNQQSAAMKAVVRQDELEDYVGTVGQTFLGLTTNCARCHDHKFDPILQSEYYALCSALDGVRHGDRDVTPESVISEAATRKAEVEAKLKSLSSALSELEAHYISALEHASDHSKSLVLQPYAHWDFDEDFNDRFGDLHGESKGDARIEDGALVVDGQKSYVITKPINEPIAEKTLTARVNLANLTQRGGGVISLFKPKKAVFDSIVFGERTPGHWMAGSNHFKRTRSVDGSIETQAADTAQHLAISYARDGTVSIYRNGERYGSAYQADQLQPFGDGDVLLFGIRLLPPQGNHLLAGRIEEASLFDRVLNEREIRDLAAGAEFISDEALTAAMPPRQRERRMQLRDEISRLRSTDTSVPRQFAYAVQPRQPNEPTRLLIRGNTSSPGDVVAPAGISAIKGSTADFGLAADASETQRRRQLAAWIASPENPLFARVIVNRLWHHHFGAGLVRTTNDFGFTGGEPSHPELLDFLAARLIESNWSLKSVHELIVTSATWQQAARSNPDATAIDAENRLLWRGNRMRMDAETLRDSILLVSDQLNDAVGGPSFRDFTTFNFNSQFYDMIDPVGPEFNRRTIYRMVIRSGRNRMLDAFDCPDPSATAPTRAVTTTPLQSLSLMNHSFVLRMAEQFGERVKRMAGDDVASQVDLAARICWLRPLEAAERKSLVRFTEKHELPALCRVLINSNEFLYVD